MKYALIGIVLILYATLLTPAFILPDDVLVSTGYILLANAILGTTLAAILVPLWIISGYIALEIGLCMVGHFPFRMKHPVAVIVTLCVLGYVIYWFVFIRVPLNLYIG